MFDSLDEYVDFVNWQRKQGLACPVLALQSEYDTQGNKVYKRRATIEEPSVTYAKSILNKNETRPKVAKLIDASRDSAVYNQNMFAGFDPDNLYIGEFTPLDKMYNSLEKSSTNAMDKNWGGSHYTIEALNEMKRKKKDRNQEFSPKFIYKENAIRTYKK